MVATILDQELEERLIEERRVMGADRYDEVWDGVYVMAPMANDEHQEISTILAGILVGLIQLKNLGEVRAGVNVSDRKKGWKKSFRCPDVAVFLHGTSAELCGSFWYGGPDFAVEVVSPGDRTRDKFDFYTRINTRELLIVDRDPWVLELYRLRDRKLELVDESTLESPSVLVSEVVPLSFRLQPGSEAERPEIELRHRGSRQRWVI